MSSRRSNLIVLVVFLLTVPAGVYWYFTSPNMGYPKSTAGAIAGLLAIVGVTLLAITLRQQPSDSASAAVLPAKAGWGVLIGFLVLTAVAVAYFTLSER